MAKSVKYKFRETNQSVWISGSGGTSASIATDVTAIKKPQASYNAFTNARILGLGNDISYATQEGIIPVSSSEELWVYRGYQPIGTVDADAYKYNPYLHRPYKLYSVVATQSGVPASTLTPEGTPLFSETQFGMYNARVIAEVGNPTTQSYTTAAVSGSFEINHEKRIPHLYVWTRYVGGNYNPPAFGSQIAITGLTGDLSGSTFIISQNQGGTLNTSPSKLLNVNLTNGRYHYSSSVFDDTGVDGGTAYGSTVFGVYDELSHYSRYNAVNSGSSSTTMSVYYTSSLLTSSFFQIAPGRQVFFDALSGTPSASGDTAALVPKDSFVVLDSTGVAGQTVPNYFAYKIDKVYGAYSSSLSQSIDGLYIFNQVPSTDIQITSSIRVDAWTGSDPSSGAVYGSGSYGTSSYGAGELGDGNTWPTASIKIFKGNFPNFVPVVDVTGSLISTVSASLLTSSTFHVSQGSPTQHTMSYLMTESINYRDCLSMAITVESGSAASSSVQNALFVKDYYMEFVNKPIVTGEGLVPVNLEGAYSGALPFEVATDCQPLLNNINSDRRNGFFFDVDYSFGIYNPINFNQIISRSAEYAAVQESNYTTRAIIFPRYIGTRVSSNNYNTIEGGGSYGLPVIDYERAFFGYANEITDPYPVINAKTQVSLKYLVDESGKVSQPNLSDWSTFDVEGTWDEEGLASLSINPQEQQTQYLSLNGIQQPIKVAKRVVPILYSQTASSGYATALPMGGFAGIVSNYTADFTNYYLVAGGDYSQDNDKDDKQINYFPLAASQSYITGSGQTIGSGGSVADVGSLYTGSSTNPRSGVIKFDTDTFATSTNFLSDNYTIRLEFELPTTRPRKWRIRNGTVFRSERWSGEVGDIKVQLLESTSNTFTTSSPKVPLKLNSVNIIFYFQNGNSPRTFNLVSILGDEKCGLRLNSKQLLIEVDGNQITSAFEQTGQNYDDVAYSVFSIDLESAPSFNLRSDRFYAFQAIGDYNNEGDQTDRNKFNPTKTQYDSSGVPLTNPPTSQATITISGDKTGQNSQDNALNAPFWYFPDTDESGAASSSFGVIQLSSSNGNTLYNSSIQKSLAYSASANTDFPGNFEPIDTSWPKIEDVWSVQQGDEIRFENNENEVYKIEKVIPPGDNYTFQLRLQVDRDITPSVNKDFFLIRRYKRDGSVIILNREFPYPGTPGNRREFITNPGAYSGSGFQPATGSYFQLPPEPLRKKQLTTSGILFPEFPTYGIQNEPDLIIKQLRDNKLID